MKKLIVLLSGPSCVGKTPLVQAFTKLNPCKKIGKPVLYTSRKARSIESEGIDYFFRSEDDVRALDPARYIIAQTRHIWQAIDVNEFFRLVDENEMVIYDGHPELVKRFLGHDKIKSEIKDRIVRMFLQPARLDEIHGVKKMMGEASLQKTAASMMTPKLFARTLQQGKELTPDVLQDIHIRAGHAWEEILIGQDYDHIIVNHDGEDSPNWRTFPPSGEAGETLSNFSKIIQQYLI